MATRYVVMPTLGWWEEADAKQYLARTIHEEERTARSTGLLDANGVKLYAVNETQPIGFVIHKR